MIAPPRKVVITQKFFDEEAIAYLTSQGCEVEIASLPEGMTEADLDVETIRTLLSGAGGWIVGHARVTRDVLSSLPDLAIVSRRGVGYEKVDARAAEELGKVVTIAAGGNNDSVADQVIGMMIGLGRRFREAQQNMNAGRWNILVGTELFRKTVGIVGFGRIGRSLARRLQGFEAEILVSSPRLSTTDIDMFGLQRVDLATLLERSDYVSLHAPLRPDTRHMINAGALARMKSSAVLINTARGGLVDDAALLDALRAGQIFGAGLDVFESESDPSKQPVTDALIASTNVLAAPHAGASTSEALRRTNMIAARCVVAVLDETPLPEGCIVADGRSRVA